MNRTKAIIIGITILIFIIILMQNTDEVTINVFFWEIDIALYYIPILMTCCAVLGFIAGKLWDKKNRKDDYDIF